MNFNLVDDAGGQLFIFILQLKNDSQKEKKL